jgi:hypothetical protein
MSVKDKAQLSNCVEQFGKYDQRKNKWLFSRDGKEVEEDRPKEGTHLLFREFPISPSPY